MIEIRNLSVGYENTNVLQDINLKFQPGEITVLAGPNGCGKSTLLKSIVRIVPHSQGEILIDDNMEWYCPNCGNRDHNTLNVARRTCGYIGSNFWNKGRTQEIKERVLHL